MDFRDAVKPNVGNLTLFTDASYLPDSRAGGGGFWAKGGTNGCYKKQGGFTIPDAQDSAEAETICALRSILLLEDCPEGKKLFSEGPNLRLVVVCDFNGLNAVFKKTSSLLKRPHIAELAKKVFSLIDSYKILVKINWVKGHNSDGTPRTWVNNLVDSLASKAAKDCRKELAKTPTLETF